MKTFKYWVTGWSRELLFQCQATGILEADKLFMAATGINPEKVPWIGCTMEKDPKPKEA